MIVLALAAALPWISAGDHALYPPDEGRYASASQSIVSGGHWLVPMVDGRAHLTKPPLAYWLQSIALRLLGHDELAVRLPSLIASTALVMLVFFAGRRWRGWRFGLCAAAVLSVMPLHVVVGRMAITDPLLAACWFMALLGGLWAAESGRIAHVLLLWTGIALGLMVKGPLALTPLAVILAWLIVSGRWRDMRRLHPMVGLPLAVAPLLIWAVLAARAYPEAWTLWRSQTLGRIVGEVGAKSHSEPPWFYLPIFIAGLFPATVMFRLPWLNVSWRGSVQAIRRGDQTAFWIIAIIVPLLSFIAMTGKLATYLLPLAAPAAMLAAIAVERWISGETDVPSDGSRPADFVPALSIVNIVLAALAFVALFFWRRDIAPLPLALAALALVSIGLWRLAGGRVESRIAWLAAVWLAAVGSWCGFFECEDTIRAPTDQGQLVERLRRLTGHNHLHVAIYGFHDPCIEFYAASDVEQMHDAPGLAQLAASGDDALVLLVDPVDWDQLLQTRPDLQSMYTRVESLRRWFDKRMDVYRPARVVALSGPIS
ncbi:MAG TPA: glycosyltransferase family 39 protein [Phycisphaerales bacterium]|nr:glycosyltransferase family 39 protein [Phycisphaerales bacterium]